MSELCLWRENASDSYLLVSTLSVARGSPQLVALSTQGSLTTRVSACRGTQRFAHNGLSPARLLDTNGAAPQGGKLTWLDPYGMWF